MDDRKEKLYLVVETTRHQAIMNASNEWGSCKFEPANKQLAELSKDELFTVADRANNHHRSLDLGDGLNREAVSAADFQPTWENVKRVIQYHTKDRLQREENRKAREELEKQRLEQDVQEVINSDPFDYTKLVGNIRVVNKEPIPYHAQKDSRVIKFLEQCQDLVSGLRKKQLLEICDEYASLSVDDGEKVLRNPILKPGEKWSHLFRFRQTSLDDLLVAKPELSEHFHEVIDWVQRKNASDLQRWNNSVLLLIDSLGDISMQERWKEGVLPHKETKDFVRKWLFLPLDSIDAIVQYKKLKASDIWHDDDCPSKYPYSDGAAEFSSEDATELSSEQWRMLKMIKGIVSAKDSFPEEVRSDIDSIRTDPRIHTGTCSDCGKDVQRSSVKVNIRWCGEDFSRVYAL